MKALWRYRTAVICVILLGGIYVLPFPNNLKGMTMGFICSMLFWDVISIRWGHLTIGQVIGSKERFKRRISIPLFIGYIAGSVWFMRVINNPVGLTEAFCAGLVFSILIFSTLGVTAILLMPDE